MFVKKSSLKERMVFVVIKIITQELEIESNLKQRLEFICEFCHIKPTIINGSIRKIDKTNLSYIEPHKIIVKDTTFLVFNYSTDIYVGSLNKKIQLVELKDYWNFSLCFTFWGLCDIIYMSRMNLERNIFDWLVNLNSFSTNEIVASQSKIFFLGFK